MTATNVTLMDNFNMDSSQRNPLTDEGCLKEAWPSRKKQSDVKNRMFSLLKLIYALQQGPMCLAKGIVCSKINIWC